MDQLQNKGASQNLSKRLIKSFKLNDFPILQKNREVRNREWNFGNSGILELRGDDENQSRKLLLREERQKEYNEYMNQVHREHLCFLD